MNSRIRRSSRFFNFVALAMRARRAAGVPAFLLAAAALGVAAVPAHAANVTVYSDAALTTQVASGDTLDEVKDSVQSGYVVVFSDDADSGTTLSFSTDATLTLRSDSDTVRTVTGTADFFSFADGTTNTLNLSDLVFDGNGSVCFASVSAGTLEIVGDEATIRNMNSSSYGGAIHAGTTTNLGTVTLSGTLTFSTNTSSGHGGALAAENVTLSGRTTFTGNKGSSGGAIYAYSSSGTVTFSGDGSTTTFTGNTASRGNGGAIYAGSVMFSGAGASATFSGNTANGAANDVYAKGNVSVSGTGTYSFGGGVVTAGTGALTISDGATVTFGAGSITSLAGALELSGATLTIAGGNTTSFAVGGGVALGTGTNSLVFEVGEGQLDDDGETLLLSGDASALASSPEVMTLRYTGSGAANVERLLSASGSGVVLTETEYAFTLTRGGNVVGYGNALDAYTKAGASVSVADGSVITVYADGANAAPLVFSQSATLTLRSATAGVVRTITGTDGTERFFSFAGSMNTLNLSDLVFDGNGSLRFARDNSGTLEIVGDNVTIRNMASEGVGAIYADRVILLGKLTFSGDECDYGGAVGAHGSVSLLGSGSTTTFSNNTASTGDGGAIYAGTDVTFSGDGASTTFTNNTASTGDGGAIFTYSGNVTFSGDGASATFSGNTANGAANDVYAGGNVSVSGTGTYSFGGGIVTAGTLSISDGATVTFADGAINAIAGATTISGAGTTATFANDGAGALNTFSGGLTVSDGATVKIGTSAATPADAGTVTFAGDGATLDFTGGAFAFEDGAKLALSGSGLTMKLENWTGDASNALTLGAETTLELTGAGAQTVGGALTLSGAGAKFSAGGALALGDVKMGGGEISATGDLTISGAITDAAGTGSASGTLSGANVTIDLSAQTQALTLGIKATDGSIAFPGATAGALSVDSFLQAKNLVVGADETDASGNQISTQVSLSRMNGISETISIGKGDVLTVGDEWGMGMENTIYGTLTVTNAGTLNFRDSLYVESSAVLNLVGNGEDNVANFTGRSPAVHGALNLSEGAHAKFTGAFGMSAPAYSPASVSLTGNSTLELASFTDYAYPYASAISIESGSTLTIGSDATINSALTLGGALRAGTLADGVFSADKNLEIAGALANGAGTISAKNITLNGLYGADENAAATTALTAAGTLTLNGATKTRGNVRAGTLAVSGTATLLSSVVATAGTTIADGATLTVGGAAQVALGAITLEEGGRLAVTNTGAIHPAGAASVSASGTLELDEGARLSVDGAVEIAATGTLVLDGGALSSGQNVAVASAIADASGEISATDISLNGLYGADENAAATTALTATGTLTLNGATNTSGNVTAGTLAVSGTATLSGTLGAGATEVSGTLTLDGAADVSRALGTATLATGGTLNVDADATADVVFAADATGATVSLTNATLSGDATLTGATNALNLTGATITGALTASAGTLTLSGANSVGSASIADAVSVNQLAGSVLTLTSGVLSVADYALGAGAKVAGDVESAGGTVAVAGEIDGALTLTDGADASVAGTGSVTGATTAQGGTTLRSEGSLGAVSVVDSTFVQNGGSAASVSVSLTAAGTASAFTQTAGTVSGDVLVDGAGAGFTQSAGGEIAGTLTLSNGATAEVSGTIGEGTTNLSVVNIDSRLTQHAGTIRGLWVAGSFVQESAGEISNLLLMISGTAEIAGTVATVNFRNSTDAVVRQSGGTINRVNCMSGSGRFEQSGGYAGSVSVASAGFFVEQTGGTIETLGVASTSEASLGGIVKNLALSGTAKATLTANQSFETLRISGGAEIDAGTHDVTVASAIADGAGTISAKNIALNGLYGADENAAATTTLTATGTLTLAGSTNTSGAVAAGTLRTSGAATLLGDVNAARTYVSGTLTVGEAATTTAAATLSSATARTLGTTTVEDGGSLVLNTDTTADVYFEAGAANASVTISGATLTGGVTLTGATNALNLADATITGALTASAGTINVSGANTAGRLAIYGAEVVLGAGASLTARAFTQDEDSTFTGDLAIVGGSARIAGTVNGGVSLTGVAADTNSTLSATVTGGLALADAALTQTGGSVAGATTLAGGSTLTQTAGTLNSVSVEDSTFVQNGGSAASVFVSLTAAGTASAFTQNAGTVSGNVAIDGAGAGFTQSAAGFVSGTLTLSGGATANVAGTVSGATSVLSGSELTQTAGTLAAVELMDGARFVQTGGSAGAVSSWNCGVDVAGTVDSLTLQGVEADKGATVSGTVTGATSLSDGSALTQTAGTLNSVVVSESNFIQNGGSAASVSVSGESSTATLGGAVKNLSISAGAATLAADQTFETLAISGGAIDAGTHDVTVSSAVANGAGTISARNLSLNGLSGTTALRATETLTLAGTTSTDGTVMAGTLLAVSGDATLSGIVVAGATTVSGALTLEANGNVGALNVAATGALRLGERVSADASGATVSGELALGAGSTLNVTGTDAVAVKSLTMNGGWLHARGDVTVASAIADGAGSVLGNNVTLNGASVAAGKTLSAVAYDTLTLAGETTGLRVSADERLVVTGTATLSDVYVGHYSAGTAGATEISGTLTLVASDAADAEHVIGATTLKSGGTLNVNTDATADVVFAADATGATVNVSGATLTGDVTLSGATNVLTLTNANVAGTLTATGGLLHLFETNTAGAVAISDGATVVMEEGATLTATGAFVQDADSRFVGDVEVENGPATIAGTVVGFVSLTDVAADTNSTLRADVTGGLSLDASTLTMEGGAVAGTTTLSNASALTQEGGALGDVFVADSTFTQTGGSAQSVTIRRTEGAAGVPAASTIAGRTDEVVVSGDGLGLAFTGHGETRRLLIQGDGATLTMDGGYIEALHVADGATATISDGVVDKIGILAGSDDVAATVVLAKAETELDSLSLMGAGAKLDAGTNALTVAGSATSSGEIVAGTLTVSGEATLSGKTTATTTLALAGSTLAATGAGSSLGAVTATDADFTLGAGARADSVTLEAGATAEVSGTVSGATTLANGSTLTQTAGTLGSVSVEDSNFVQNGGTALRVSVSGESSTATLGGAVSNLSVSAGTATLAADQTFETLAISGGEISGAFDVTVASAIADGAGTISAKNVTLNGLYGADENAAATTALTATGTLTLAGTTNAIGEIVAGTLAVSGTATLSGAVSAGATEVSGTLTLDGAAGVSRELGDVTMSSGGVFEVNTDATADVVFAADATGATVSVSGATLTGNVTLSGDATNALNLSNATIAGTLTATGGTLSLDGANAADRVRIGSGAVVTQTEGATLSATAVDVVDSTFVLERGASIGAAVYVESGRAEIAGTIANHLELTNGSTLTASAGSTVRSLYAENSSVNLAGEAETVRVVRDENAAEDLAASEISGVVSGRLSVVNAEATLSGSAADVSVAGAGANFTQTAGGAISGTLDASHGATATLAGTVSKIRINAFDENAAEEGTTTVTLEAATVTLEALEIHGDALLTAKTGEGEGATWNALEVTTAIADGAGKIKGGDVTLNGLSGTTAVTAMGTLTLNGATRTSGDVVANGKLVISSGAEATLSGHVGAGEARIDGALTLTGTDWEQSDRLGALISVGENGAFVVDYIAASTIRVDSASTISLKNGAWLSAALSFKTKTLELSGGAKLYNAFRNEDQTLEVVEKIEDGDGTIEGGTVTLRGGVSGNVNVSAMKDLNLGGETTTAGTLSARTISVLSGASLTADFSKIAVEETLAVNADATATLTIDAENAVVDKLTADGAVTLTGGNAFSLGNLRGAGTVEKTGAGALMLGASADFAGTLKISEGAATLSSGATFGGSLGFFSENETLTLGADSSVAGTLTLGAGTTLELGGRDAKATVSVGALAAGGSSALPFSVRAQSASTGAATIVHDVYSASEYDVLRVGAGADLSFATALLRAGSGLNVSALADAPDGVTLTLVEGDVARGYGALRLADELALANFALSPDGTTASVGLGANALAAGVFPLETTADQRSVAQAATRAGTASGYGAALNALTNPHDTLAALDALGAAHAAAMMPAQIDGTWNRLRGVMNAAGTGARLGSETELAAWAQYAGSWTDVDSSRERASWTRRMHGAHAGVERAFASGWTAGAALGYEDSEQKIGGAKIEDDALSASFYARRTQDAFTQTAALSFARHDYETRRTVAFPGYAARTRGDTLGFTAALSYEASYAFAVADWAKLSPVASLSAAWNTIEGWTESGADAALRCGDQDALTWLAGVGGRADFEFANPFSAEAKARAGAYALFTAEFGERSCGVDAEFADTGAGFTARYDDPSRYALQLGVTASLPLSVNTSLFGGVSTELREDETNLNANLGVRFTW